MTIEDKTTMMAIGEIARLSGVPIHRVSYVIRTRQITPIGRAGNTRVFSSDSVERISSELKRIDEERGGSCRVW